MALTRDQRRAMERSLSRMRQRREHNEQRQAARLPMTPANTEGFAPEGRMSEADADGVTIVDPPASRTPSRGAVEHVASRMWWAAQSPVIAEDQRAKLLRARDTVLQESALA